MLLGLIGWYLAGLGLLILLGYRERRTINLGEMLTFPWVWPGFLYIYLEGKGFWSTNILNFKDKEK